MTGFVKESATSLAAALSMRGAAGRLRGLILETIGIMGDATCDEVETLLDLRHQTASARVTELAQSGLIIATGDKRKTRSGRYAVVYIPRRVK